MKNPTIPHLANTDPGPMLDALIRTLQLPDDAALADRLELTPRMLGMVREGRLLVSPSMLLQMHAVSGLSVGLLEDMLHGSAVNDLAVPLPRPGDQS